MSLAGLVAALASRPTGFEPFCADPLRACGFQAEIALPARDGGTDLRTSWQGRTHVVECKCYNRSHRVGGPVIQKLQGAGTVERADRMAVVATSAFSQDALDYADRSRRGTRPISSRK